MNILIQQLKLMTWFLVIIVFLIIGFAVIVGWLTNEVPSPLDREELFEPGIALSCDADCEIVNLYKMTDADSHVVEAA